jgi:hypothetical protein
MTTNYFLGVYKMGVHNDDNANDNNRTNNVTLAIIKWFFGIVGSVISGVLLYYLTHPSQLPPEPPKISVSKKDGHEFIPLKPKDDDTKGSFCCDTNGEHRCSVITRTPLQIGTDCHCDGLGDGHVCK